MYYAYVHCRPDNSVFYVGKGSARRAKTLKSNGKRNKYHQRVVSKYGVNDIAIGMIECSSEAAAFELEIGLIKCLKRMGVKLTNMTEGGEGQSGHHEPLSNSAQLFPCSRVNKVMMRSASPNFWVRSTIASSR